MEKDGDWLSEEIKNARGKDVRNGIDGGAHQPCLPIAEHWGLDPLLMVHVKLFIGDVLSLPSWPGCTGISSSSGFVLIFTKWLMQSLSISTATPSPE
jgi:hypothetical protein